ncbi:MAG: beta-ketoacyl-[acyl-carrier-protein] synthase family protein [Gammaproteobacteria bacterium]|nr:MAG: beta-ketoacyl-[acyl-carrier-protein] synthase family protein [Gammaproteobacteria bacterium]
MSSALPPVTLSALGMLNALGNNTDEVLANLLAGSAPGMRKESGWVPGRELPVGRVTAELPPLPAGMTAFDCRNNRLLLAALAQIRPAIDAAITRYGADRIAIVIGSSTSGIGEGEAGLKDKIRHGQWPEGYHYRQQEIGTAAECVARALQLDGMAYTISTACSSSAKALGSARRLLAMDLCDAVICGGADSLCQLTLNGFTALESVSPEVCEPLADGRDGITIGEAAAVFLMEKGSSGIVLAGVGESADAHHISAPQPEGIGAEAAMRAALADAGIEAGQLDYINLHGTATPLNDAMETAAVFRVAGDRVPVSSTKPLTGHTLGAAGATEAGLCWLLLSSHNRDGLLPAQRNQRPADPALAAVQVLRTSQALPHKATLYALSNSFAFGGSNASLVLERRTA